MAAAVRPRQGRWGRSPAEGRAERGGRGVAEGVLTAGCPADCSGFSGFGRSWRGVRGSSCRLSPAAPAPGNRKGERVIGSAPRRRGRPESRPGPEGPGSLGLRRSTRSSSPSLLGRAVAHPVASRPRPARGDLEGSGARHSFPSPRGGHPFIPRLRPHWVCDGNPSSAPVRGWLVDSYRTGR